MPVPGGRYFKSISEAHAKDKSFFLDTLTPLCYYEVCTIVAAWALKGKYAFFGVFGLPGINIYY